MSLIQPKDITITDGEGKERHFVLSKFPAIAGREIVAKYPVANMPATGDYSVSQEIMKKLMSYVGVKLGDKVVPMVGDHFINEHCGDWEVLAKLEMAMMEYNCSFFRNGRASTFFQEVARKYLPKIFEMLTDSLVQSSQAEKPHSKS